MFSLDLLTHRDLLPLAAVQPAAIAPLTIHRYALARTLPRVAIPDLPETVLRITERPGWIEVHAEVSRGAVLVVRDARDPGWSAVRNGQQVPWERADHHLAVRLEGGANHVTLSFRPPSLIRALLCAAAAVVVLGFLLMRDRRSRARPD